MPGQNASIACSSRRNSRQRCWCLVSFPSHIPYTPHHISSYPANRTSAGVRDSPLTTHGVLQARRLGSHLAARSAIDGPITHVFSSDLQRAANTAQAVINAFTPAGTSAAVTAATVETPGQEQVRLVRVPELRERDFGEAEGKRYGASHRDAETPEMMRARATRFVVTRLAPVLHDYVAKGQPGFVVVVSHGIFLGSLLRVLLERYGVMELLRLVGPGLTPPRPLASWSNTGYLELAVSAPPQAPPSGERNDRSRCSVNLTVVQINTVQHLEGLRKTRGRIGNARFDTRQRTVDSFFKPAPKRKSGDSN